MDEKVVPKDGMDGLNYISLAIAIGIISIVAVEALGPDGFVTATIAWIGLLSLIGIAMILSKKLRR